MTDKRKQLRAALRDLNIAAYAAIRAGQDTTEFPYLDRARLRDLCRATDDLFEFPMVDASGEPRGWNYEGD